MDLRAPDHAAGDDDAPRSTVAPGSESADAIARLVAHAINNPLAALVLDLDLAAELLSGPASGDELRARIEEARKLLVDARQSADRVHAVVAELRRSTTAADAVRVLSIAPPSSPVSAPRLASANAARVLIVDDDTLVAAAVKRTLAAHEVRVVTSARDALSLFEAGERFDVVLCDLMMPGMTGMDLHAALLELDLEQAARVVFVTGGAVTTRAREFVATTTNQVVEKPFDVHKLRDLIARTQKKPVAP